MILKGAEIARYLARPDPSRPALLIYGQDAMRVAMKRAEAVKALVGEKADEEMRLTRLPGASLRKDPAQLLDAVKEVGFFPGPRVVLVEDTPDAAADAVRAALLDWKPGDAAMVVTAGALGKSSALRKLFEPHPTAVTAPIYDDPPGEDEVARWMADAGLRQVPPAAMKEMMVLARALDPGDLRQTIEKIGLYKHGDPAPLAVEEIALMAPATIEADLDELIHIVAERRHLPRGRQQVGIAQPQQRRLARPRRAGQEMEHARLQGQRHVRQQLGPPVIAEADIPHLDHAQPPFFPARLGSRPRA